MENWKDVVGFEGLYEVSDCGAVRSKLRYVRHSRGDGLASRYAKLRKLWADKDGYLCVDLSKDGKVFKRKVHRLVAEAFIPNSANAPTVNHLNSVKADNRKVNLEWATRKENSQHAARSGVFSATNNAKRGKVSAETVIAIRAERAAGVSYNELGRKFGTSATNARAIAVGNTWKELM